MATALYPGRFDPVTNGHVDITQRAASLFADVTVAVYDLAPKDCLFSTTERVAMFRDAVKHLDNVTVKTFDGLVVDFARKGRNRKLVRVLPAS